MERRSNGAYDLGVEGKIGDVLLEVDKRKYRIKEVEAFEGMGAMITKEADSMSAMRFRMMKADRDFWMDKKKTRKRELLKRGSTQDTEKWCSHVFFTLVKGGAGTKRCWMLCTVEKAEIWIL